MGTGRGDTLEGISYLYPPYQAGRAFLSSDERENSSKGAEVRGFPSFFKRGSLNGATPSRVPGQGCLMKRFHEVLWTQAS